MNLQEAAQLLRVSDDTLRRWVRQGLIRGHGAVGARFERAEIEAWARRRGLALAGAARDAPTPTPDLLASAVERGAAQRDVAPGSALEAIALAVQALDVSEEGRAELFDAVLERERMATTGLGHGVAVPHPRVPPGHLVSEAVVSVLFPDQPLDWAALDGEPVHSVFLLVSPSARVHVDVLGRLAFALRSPGFPAFLRDRPSRDELCGRLRSMSREG